MTYKHVLITLVFFVYFLFYLFLFFVFCFYSNFVLNLVSDKM